MDKLNRTNKLANFLGLSFGIVFTVIFLIGTVFPFGAALDTKAYLESGIHMIYTIGLFIGLRWKGPGILICLVSIVTSVIVYFVGRTTVNYTYVIVFPLIQMIPVSLYIVSWCYHRQMKII